MLYNLTWLTIKPGKIADAHASLSSLAATFSADHGVQTRVYVPISSGSPYRAALVAGHEGLAKLHAETSALITSDTFAKWFSKAKDLLDWPSTEAWIVRSIKANNAPEGWWPNFITIVGISIQPGKVMEATDFMVRMAEHIESAHQTHVDVVATVTGPSSRRSWVVGYDTAEQADTLLANLQGDSAYLALAAQMAEYFVGQDTTVSFGRYL